MNLANWEDCQHVSGPADLETKLQSPCGLYRSNHLLAMPSREFLCETQDP